LVYRNYCWSSRSFFLAAFTATGFAVAGIHAFQILRNKHKELHKKAFKIAITFGAIAAIKDVAVRQPVKLAAMEAHYETGKGVPLYIGGIVDKEKKEVNYKVKIPNALSFLAFGDFNAEVKGLNDFPEDEIPNFLESICTPFTCWFYSFGSWLDSYRGWKTTLDYS